MKSKDKNRHVKLDKRHLVEMSVVSPSIGSTTEGSSGCSAGSSSISSGDSQDGDLGMDDDEEYKPCPFAQIPYELFINICEFLSEEEYLTLLGVSRYFHRAIAEADSIVWRQMCFEKWKFRQGCHNLVLFYEQLEQENLQQEKWVVALTQRMLLGCFEAMKDSDVVATDGLCSVVSVTQSLGPGDAKKDHLSISSPLLQGSKQSVLSSSDAVQLGDHLNESVDTSLGNEALAKPTHQVQENRPNKRDVRFSDWSSPTASVPSYHHHNHHRHHRRRHRKPHRRRHHHKHRNRRSNRHENRKKKGYRHHQKSNPKMSKSARRRLRHQRSKRRAQQSPLPLTATYNAIKNSLPTVDMSEVEPDTTKILSLNSRGVRQGRRAGGQAGDGDSGSTPAKDVHGAGRVSNVRPAGAPPSKSFWWNLTPEERLLQIARQQKCCQHQSQQGASSTDRLEDFYHAWDMLDLPLEDNNDSSRSLTRSASVDSSHSDLSSEASITSREQQENSANQSSREHFSRRQREGVSRSRHPFAFIGQSNIHMTALEEAILILRHKCLSFCSLQRRSASVPIVPFTSRHPRIEGASPTSSDLIHHCQFTHPPARLSSGGGSAQDLQGVSVAASAGEQREVQMITPSPVLPNDYVISNSEEETQGKERECSDFSSGEWNHGLERELEQTDDELTYGPISWKFAFYMSRREARRKTLTLHDLVQGMWMVCFRATGKCHPVRFLPNSTVVIDPPLSLLEGVATVSDRTPVGSASLSAPSVQQATMPFHIMQSGARLSFNRLILTVHHRSSIARSDSSLTNTTRHNSFHACRSRLNATLPSNGSQTIPEEKFNDEPNASVAYLRKAAEDLVLGKEFFPCDSTIARKRNSSSKPRNDGPQNLSTAISHLFGWAQGTDRNSGYPTPLRMGEISDEARKAVDDDWGWTIGNEMLKFFSVELSPPLYIQRLQQISEGKPL